MAYADKNKSGGAGKMQNEVHLASNPIPHSLSGSPKDNKPKKKRRQEEPASAFGHESTCTLPPAKKAKYNSTLAKGDVVEQPDVSYSFATNDKSATESMSMLGSSSGSGVLDKLEAYTITDMNIISSSQIQAKVSRIIEILSRFSFVVLTKPNIVSVHAKGSVSSKLITIVEIVKREIAKAGGKWYQYSSLGQATVNQERKPTATVGTGRTIRQSAALHADAMDVDDSHRKDEQESDDEEEAFEVMKTPLERALEGRPKIRAVPILTIYLSRVRVEALKAVYGLVFSFDEFKIDTDMQH